MNLLPTVVDLFQKAASEQSAKKMPMPSTNAMVNSMPVFGYSQLAQTAMKQTRVPLMTGVAERAQQAMELIKKQQQM